MSSKNTKYKFIILALFVILVCKAVVFEFYMVSSDSMSEAILPGDFILINRLVYGARTPNKAVLPFFNYEFSLPSYKIPALRDIRQGDVVVIRKDKYPECENNLVKRVAAAEGQSVTIIDEWVFVDEMLFCPESIAENGQDIQIGDDSFTDAFTVPAGKIFVLGDNLLSSYDSREFGFVDAEEVIGKAVIIYASKDEDGFRWSRFFKPVE
jgi:signal peptidase I